MVSTVWGQIYESAIFSSAAINYPSKLRVAAVSTGVVNLVQLGDDIAAAKAGILGQVLLVVS